MSASPHCSTGSSSTSAIRWRISAGSPSRCAPRSTSIPGAWEREDLLAHYAKVRGVDVDPVAVTWWNTFASFKTAVMQVSGLRAFLEGRSDDLYQPRPKVLRTLLTSIGDLDATHA